MAQVRTLKRGHFTERKRKTFWIRPWFILLVAVIGGLLFWSLSPAKQWLQQQREMVNLQKRIDALKKENQAFEQEIARLKTEGYVEREARKELGLVKPGESAYAVISPSDREDFASQSESSRPKGKKDEVTWWQRVTSFFKRIL